ncbi:unnamed protein product [Phytophthora fragariaefolia]|uniref:Unnamed protein product n=1 Tax=Phytophthora fragariaefolia TaxID=1490495 RepID=A0A9W6Y442_9STRA|nr:unnamed protein product [Phytophthora fragariaefolia]
MRGRWEWKSVEKLFEADIPGVGVGAFACFDTFTSHEREQEDVSTLAIARFSDGTSSAPSIEHAVIVHPEPADNTTECVLAEVDTTRAFHPHSKFMNVALFASIRDNHTGLAIYRTDNGVSILRLTSFASEEDYESSNSEGGDMSCDEDATVIAESLVGVPISSLLRRRFLKKYQAKLVACTDSIGDDEDESRAILKNLLHVAACIREFLSSSPRKTVLLGNLMRWCDEISELSYKWTTFQLLRNSSTSNAEGKGVLLRAKWDLFRTLSVCDLLEKYVRLGSMRAVMILWSRHLNDEAVQNIGKLLRCLPASLPVSAYARWVRHEVIPTLICHAEQPPGRSSNSDGTLELANRPLLLLDFAQWVLERSEAAAGKGDLQTAIQICNLLKAENGNEGSESDTVSYYEFKLRSVIETNYTALTEAEEHQVSDPFKRVESFSQKLRHVKHLAAEHNFVISLAVFEDETPATIAMSMLDRVLTPDALKKEVEEHVRNYLRYCDVSVDPVLHDYITELTESIQTSQSVEETRALALLDEIHDTSIRADATLALLRSALPPYSQALKRYANLTKIWKTDRIEEIEEHLRLMKIQDMLTTYDIMGFDIADAKSASRMVSHILNQISRPSAFTDAMLLVDVYSDLHCNRAVVQFTENMFIASDEMLTMDDEADAVDIRVKMAMNALAEVKKRKEPRSHVMLFVSLMEEIVEFGVMLLEMEVEALEATDLIGQEKLHNEISSQSFVLPMLLSLTAAYLSELKELTGLADQTQNYSIVAYTENPSYLLSSVLLTDLQRICRVKAHQGVMLSLSLLRDPERCEMKLKQLMNPEVLFAECGENANAITGDIAANPVTYAGKGKGKKRAIAPSGQSSLKRQRTSETMDTQILSGASNGLQERDDRTRLIFDLNRFASAVGIESTACHSLIAQNAATSGCVLQAVRFSRDLFSRKCNLGLDRSLVNVSETQNNFHPAETLKKTAISLSLYTSSHVKSIYDVAFTRNQHLPPDQVALIQAPIYTLELLKYSLCICNKESFDETLVLLKNAMIVNEVLQFTHYNLIAKKDEVHGPLYSRWYRGDACVLPSYESMKLATRFAIAEHKNLRRDAASRDTIASKRYVSFLVEQRADLLSLQALLSMQELPDNAASVVNTQMGKLLSTVFQSQEIDNYLALGRFQQLAFIGADAARAWQQIAFLHQCVELEGNARWWHYLNLLGIECDHKALQSERCDLQYIRRLVPTLITRSNYDFYTVLEFTRHYKIDDGFPSLVYAETLLLEESATTNLEYQDKIVGVIGDIHEQHLVRMLLKSISKVSGQDYDRLLFIFRLLLEYTSYPEREEIERRIEVLRNLKAFVAFHSTAPVNTGENHGEDGAMKGNASCDSVEQDGQSTETKVSFHDLIADPSDVLAGLVTKDNFSALIGLVEPLRLEPDELQMLLLKNMITTNLRHNKSGVINTDGTGRFSAFEDILRCLSDAESRVTAAEWLAENFPVGENKLIALEFALKAAISGQNGSEDPSNTSFTGHEALTRLETKILRVKVELLFRSVGSQTSNLADVINNKKEMTELLALVPEPKKLFQELYRRYALWFYTHNNDTLHTVADSIAGLLQLPQMKLRLELVSEWLVKDAVHVGKENPSEDTKEDPFELLGLEKLHREDEKYERRVLYLANAGVKRSDSFSEHVLSYLIKFAKDARPRAGVTFRAKLRALRVILRLGQLYHGAVERFVINQYGIVSSDAFFKELLDYMKYFTHMMVFEEHRVPQLMLDFAVEASDLWEDILSRMLHLGMFRSLASIMGPLSRKSFVRSLECGRQVWEDVLTLPMIQLKQTCTKQPLYLSSSQDACPQEGNESTATLGFAGIALPSIRSVLERVVALLQRCPFLDQIDVPVFVIHLRDLAEMCRDQPNGAEVITQLDLFGFAVKCAMVIPKPVARFEALLRIIQAGAYGAVLQELLGISCFLDGEHAMEGDNSEFSDNVRLVQESFSEAAKREDYSAILGTPFEQGFVEYLAATANIDYLLSQL